MRHTGCVFLVAVLLGPVASGSGHSALVLQASILLAQSEDYDAVIREIEEGNPEWRWDSGKLPLRALMEQHRIAGMSIAVIEDFEIAWTRQYGHAQTEGEVVVTASTQFQAASITKPVTAMAVLRAVEEGKFGLDDPVNDLLTSWQLPGNELTTKRPVTPRMLLSHTAGTTVSGFPGYWPDDDLPSLSDVLNGNGAANTDPVIVDIEPFTEWRYSGGGYTILQLLLEDVYGEKYEDVMSRLILDPIGMADSHFAMPLHAEDAPAAAHAFGGRMRAPWHVYVSASLWTTPRDLAKFAIAMQKMLRGDAGGVLSKETAETMIARLPVSGSYGLGLSTHIEGDNTYFTHGGVNWGYVSRLFAHTEKGHGVVMMTNGTSRGNMPQEILRRVAITHGWQD